MRRLSALQAQWIINYPADTRIDRLVLVRCTTVALVGGLSTKKCRCTRAHAMTSPTAGCEYYCFQDFVRPHASFKLPPPASINSRRDLSRTCGVHTKTRTILRDNGKDEDTIDRGIYRADDLYRVYVFIECSDVLRQITFAYSNSTFSVVDDTWGRSFVSFRGLDFRLLRAILYFRTYSPRLTSLKQATFRAVTLLLNSM